MLSSVAVLQLVVAAHCKFGKFVVHRSGMADLPSSLEAKRL
jgi:hypothetical protein